ncbi:MAG: ribosome maturation factor RimP [Candidatus Krumholzibacteria bacterium]|nr:ribosome maturation factor RimP [Candidatus Krumholzibacteria bacterium]
MFAGAAGGTGNLSRKGMTDRELHDFLAPEVDALGFECVKLERSGSAAHPVIRLFIDHADGVSVGDCARVSRALGLVLEREDPFPGRYLLEVSSPGSNRPLVSEAHYRRFAGSDARVQAERNGARMTYTGCIRSCINDVLTLDTPDGEVSVALADIIKAQLVGREYKIDKKMKKSRRDRRAKAQRE